MVSRAVLLTCTACLAMAAVGAAALMGAPAGAVAERPASPGPPITDETRIWLAPTQALKVSLPNGREETTRSLLNIPRAMHYGDYVWSERGVPKGPVWVRVDIDRQLISVFRAGHEIGSAVILYGATGKPTPTGVFAVLQRAKTYHSNTYDAPMPFMLRLTPDGVAIHASNVREGWATHGCIGVPLEFARQLFSQVQLGDPVLIVASPPSAPAAS